MTDKIQATEAAMEFLLQGAPIPYDVGTEGIELVPEMLMHLNNERYYHATIGDIITHVDYKHRGKPIQLQVVRTDNGFSACQVGAVPDKDGKYTQIWCFSLGVEMSNIKVIKDGEK